MIVLQIHILALGRIIFRSYGIFSLSRTALFADLQLQGVLLAFWRRDLWCWDSSFHCGDPWIDHPIHVFFRSDLLYHVNIQKFLNHSLDLHSQISDLLPVLHVLGKTPRGMYRSAFSIHRSILDLYFYVQI